MSDQELPKFSLKWIGHLSFKTPSGQPVDKIWVKFAYNDPTLPVEYRRYPAMYACWGNLNKTLTVSKEFAEYRLRMHIQAKMTSHYRKINSNSLIRLWPEFHDRLNEAFVFALLSEKLKR